MHSGLKKISLLSVILSIVNALGAVLICMFLNPLEGMDFPFKLAIMAFLITAAVLFVAIAFALWNLSNDLISEADSTYETIRGLKKRIDALEKKTEV